MIREELTVTGVGLGQSKATSVCVEKERDELQTRLQETERKLREKTRRVLELEHNLEEVQDDFCVAHLS